MTNSIEVARLTSMSLNKRLKFHNAQELDCVWQKTLIVGWLKVESDFRLESSHSSSIARLDSSRGL